MKTSEQIQLFVEFLKENYHAELLDKISKGDFFIILDFSLLSKFSPELAELLLDQPEEIIKAAEIGVQEFDLPDKAKDFRVRFKNLPDAQKLLIKYMRAKHLNKFYFTEGIVRQKSDVRPQVTNARFECPNCGNIINVLQLEKKFKEPSRCSCGRKGKFRLLSKELIDVQGIVLEESSEDLEGGEQPKRINVLLKQDLVSPISDRQTNPGSKIRVIGMMKEVPLPARDGGQLTKYDLIIDANQVEAMQEDFLDLIINPEEEEIILELAKDPKIFSRLIQSVAPSIYGYERIKEALLLQLVGGTKKQRQDGVKSRGDIHILLIGDPGCGKSQLLKRTAIVAPKARFVSGKGASGAGLTAAVVKDEFLSGWSLEAGALVLANKGLCCIDELDKMSTEDRSAMHEALEGQTITISKANIQATLRAETTVLAAANPKLGRFDPYEILAKQIDLPPALINRFDLIFGIKDLPDKVKDNLLASHILDLHQNPDKNVEEINTNILRKYLAWAKTRINPKLTDGAITELKDYYI
ncbi:ATP-binding protein, partial [Nanoarchaeota archaeon]